MLLRPIFHCLALLGFFTLAACAGPTVDKPDEETTEPEPEPTTVVSLLASMPEFSTFSAALENTGLAAVLTGTGPFTIFAPTNDAFDTLNLDLAALTPDQMADLLQYHIIAGEMTGNAAQNTAWSNTLLQERIHLQYTQGHVVIDGLATVTNLDMVADNGIVHVVDGALLCASMRSRIDLFQIVSSYPRLSKFKELMESSGQLALDLSTHNINLTLFAAPNSGFNAVDIDPADMDSESAANLGKTHAITGTLDSEALEELTQLETLSGESISISSDGDLVLNENSTVVYADIDVNNGIFHIIDQPISSAPAE
jgi:transforming growth factor-beta-induced protein